MAGRPLRRERIARENAGASANYSRVSQEDLVRAFLDGYDLYTDLASDSSIALRDLYHARDQYGDYSPEAVQAKKKFQEAQDAAHTAMDAYMAIAPLLTEKTKYKYLTSRAVAAVHKQGDVHVFAQPSAGRSLRARPNSSRARRAETRGVLSDKPGYCDYCGKKALYKLPDDQETGEEGPWVCGQHAAEFGSEPESAEDSAWNDRGRDAVAEWEGERRLERRRAQQAFAKIHGTPRGTKPSIN